MFRRNLQNKTFHNNLFISLTPTQTCPDSQFDIKFLFNSLKTQIQKNTQKNYLRKRPVFYERLEKSLQRSLKFAKDHNDQAAINQRLMMQQCRNYYHTRSNTSQKKLSTQRQNYKNKDFGSNITRPLNSHKNKRYYINLQENKKAIEKKLNSLMRNCEKQNNDLGQVKKKLGLFSYFSQKQNSKLQRIKNKVQKHQRS